MHDHSHHGHHHHTVSPTQAASKAFIIGICLNLAYVIAEVIAGLYTHSLALLTDAGHNLSDVAGLALSLLAIRLTKIRSNETYTYGYNKSTILSALLNAVILLIAIGILGYESIQRLSHPQPVQGGIVAWIAALGIVINTVSALLFFRQKGELNAKGAYLHLMSDAIVSAVVVVGGIVMARTNWFWLDPVISLGVLVVILIGTWSLLTESFRLSMDAVPKEISTEEISKKISNIKGITDVHHVHIWAISTTQNALTAHIVLDKNLPETSEQNVKSDLRHMLLHENIQHVTVETEKEGDENCVNQEC